MSASPLARLRKLCLALPGAEEFVSHGAPTFRVKKCFASYSAGHYANGRPSAWIKARPVNQQLIVLAHPKQYFVPPYVGVQGWIGAWLDKVADWKEIDELLRAGYREIAPKKLLAQFDSPGAKAPAKR